MNIVLIGMPGCGKTTLGRTLATELHRSFYDADAVLVEREGRSIAELFGEGEEIFRTAETRTLTYLSGMENAVIATGGGAVTREVNMRILRQSGRTIFIDRPLKDIIADVDSATRPLLSAGKERMYRLYDERIALYRYHADYVVQSEVFAMLLPQILKLVREVDL